MGNSRKSNVVIAFGTRPEATKMAPVYLALKEMERVRPIVLLTGQHQEQLQQAISLFHIHADVNLRVMVARQGLPELAARILPAAASALRELKTDYVLVHGDTLTTFVVAWAAFLEQIPVGHVEAGLRSHNVAEPFPEEMNRRLTDVMTDLDLAPTRLARENLIREGKSTERIIVTGQTGIDAIRYAVQVGKVPNEIPEGGCITVTLHRRENWPILNRISRVLAEIAAEHPDRTFVFPVHMNPVVREAVIPVLSKVPNFLLLDPLDYGAMAALINRSDLIVTDSGGLQEEGAALGVPVVVIRNVTERPEGIASGILHIAGTDPESIRRITSELLIAGQQRTLLDRNPYGDGRAGQRVAQAVAWRLGHAGRPNEWHGDSGVPLAEAAPC